MYRSHEGWHTTDAAKGTGFAFDCWEGHAMLPRLNLDEPAVKNHIFDVARFWIEEVGIDGWRLDVAHQVSFLGGAKRSLVDIPLVDANILAGGR